MSRRRCATAARERGLALLALVCACFREPNVDPTSGDAGAGSEASTGAITSDPTTSTTDTTSSAIDESSSGESPGPACFDAEREVPPFALPWQGPVAIPMAGAGAGSCPGELAPGPRGYQGAGELGCHCACEEDEPAELCTIRIDSSDMCMLPDEAVTTSCIDVPPVAVRYGVMGSSCAPVGVVDEAGLDVVQSCRLVAGDTGCVGVPEGYLGPCVWSGEDSCPDGYPNAVTTDCIDCAPCAPCDTTAYCGSLAVTAWTRAGCRGTPSTLATECDDSMRASLQFQPPNTPLECGVTDAMRAAMRFCCA